MNCGLIDVFCHLNTATAPLQAFWAAWWLRIDPEFGKRVV